MKCDKLLAFIYTETEYMLARNHSKAVIIDAVRDYYNGDNPVCKSCNKFKKCYLKGSVTSG